MVQSPNSLKAIYVSIHISIYLSTHSVKENLQLTKSYLLISMYIHPSMYSLSKRAFIVSDFSEDFSAMS